MGTIEKAAGPTCHLEPAEASTSERILPLALYFPSGYQPTKDGCCWEIQSSKSRKGEHYLIGRTEEVDLVGHTHDTNGGPQPCRYAVGVLDRAAGTVKYSEIEAGRILRVEPRARAIKYAPSGAGAQNQPMDREKYAEQNRRLVEAFGSTVRKRKLKTRESAAVQADAVGGTEAVRSLLQSVGEKAAAASATKEDVLGRETGGSRLLPAHNPEAAVPHEAYRLHEIIPTVIWAMLDASNLERAVSDRVYKETELRANSRVPAFVLDRLGIIKDPTSAIGQRNLRGAAYLAVLMQLYSETASHKTHRDTGGLTSLAEREEIQADVLEAVLHRFYSSHKSEHDDRTIIYVRSDRQKTEMLLHILIIALILEGYQMASSVTEMLRVAVKATPDTMQNMYRQLGCVVKAAGSKPVKQYSIALLPVTTPPKQLKDYLSKSGGQGTPSKRKR